MKRDTDEVIDRVLSGIRDTATPTGMEHRILASVRNRELVKPMSGWLHLRSTGRMEHRAHRSLAWSWASGVALAGTVAVFLALTVVHRMERVPARAHLQAVAARVPAPLASGEVAESVQPSKIKTGARLVRKPEVRRAGAIRGSDASALDVMRAASYPAPPMPLTEQEKLLIRLAHKGDPVEMAMLDPMQRAVRDTEQKAEFQSFFEPKKTGEAK